jgi:hypothetical protein
VDSAQNNIRRFIVAQYDKNPFIIYQQDDWVAISNYQKYNTNDLITLWTLLNKHICKILMNTTQAAAGSLCTTNDPEPHSIEWLARDYNRHLLHHLHQVLGMDPVVYP